MSLVIDGVYLQHEHSGAARIWQSVLPLLASRLDMRIVLLDRGGCAKEIDGIEVVPFPTYKSKFNPHDSALLERICDHYEAKAFVSTHYTTPLTTPSVLLLTDMIPERTGLDLTARNWREKEMAIAHARRHICVSMQTRRDLLAYYPELDLACVSVAYCGVDPAVFSASEPAAIETLRSRLELANPYFIWVGSSLPERTHRNSKLVLDAVRATPEADFDLLCIGRSALTKDSMPIGSHPRILHADLDDASLAAAYSGALALLFPSLYEGFGLPVVEAMSCHCPVICTSNGALAEVVGDATLQIDAESSLELVAAMRTVREASMREKLIADGARQAGKYRWDSLADALTGAVQQTIVDSQAGSYTTFYKKWTELRKLQGEVDILA